jgi:YidC/Oxa1 family membrane protein insertase
MEFLISIFNTILYQPLLNILVLLYLYLPGHDFGIAVIVLTLLIKIILYPLGVQAIKSQKVLSEIQPKIREVQQKYKEDREKQTKAIMEIYQKAKINPLSGCLPLLIQLPILIALFRLFWKGFSPEQMNFLYSFVPHPGQINPYFLGMINLAAPSKILAFLTGTLQFFQTKMTLPKEKITKKEKADFSQMFQKQMLYFLPIFTVLILWQLPSAISLYWIVSTLFSIGQQYLIFKS